MKQKKEFRHAIVTFVNPNEKKAEKEYLETVEKLTSNGFRVENTLRERKDDCFTITSTLTY